MLLGLLEFRKIWHYHEIAQHSPLKFFIRILFSWIMLIKYNLASDSYVTTYSQAAQAQKDGEKTLRPVSRRQGQAQAQELSDFWINVFQQSYILLRKEKSSLTEHLTGSEISLKYSSLLSFSTAYTALRVTRTGTWLNKPQISLIFKGQGLALFFYNSSDWANSRYYSITYVKCNKMMQVYFYPSYIRYTLNLYCVHLISNWDFWTPFSKRSSSLLPWAGQTEEMRNLICFILRGRKKNYLRPDLGTFWTVNTWNLNCFIIN